MNPFYLDLIFLLTNWSSGRILQENQTQENCHQGQMQCPHCEDILSSTRFKAGRQGKPWKMEIASPVLFCCLCLWYEIGSLPIDSVLNYSVSYSQLLPSRLRIQQSSETDPWLYPLYLSPIAAVTSGTMLSVPRSTGQNSGSTISLLQVAKR